MARKSRVSVWKSSEYVAFLVKRKKLSVADASAKPKKKANTSAKSVLKKTTARSGDEERKLNKRIKKRCKTCSFYKNKEGMCELCVWGGNIGGKNERRI